MFKGQAGPDLQTDIQGTGFLQIGGFSTLLPRLASSLQEAVFLAHLGLNWGPTLPPGNL